jgi:hypothetical protein
MKKLILIVALFLTLADLQNSNAQMLPTDSVPGICNHLPCPASNFEERNCFHQPCPREDTRPFPFEID